MTRETSLDEFAASVSEDVDEGDGEDVDIDEGDGEDVDVDEGDGEDGGSAGEGDPSPDRSGVAVTLASVPGGAPCDDCGAVVDLRWADDAGLVCLSCKEW